MGGLSAQGCGFLFFLRPLSSVDFLCCIAKHGVSDGFMAERAWIDWDLVVFEGGRRR